MSYPPLRLFGALISGAALLILLALGVSHRPAVEASPPLAGTPSVPAEPPPPLEPSTEVPAITVQKVLLAVDAAASAANASVTLETEGRGTPIQLPARLELEPDRQYRIVARKPGQEEWTQPLRFARGDTPETLIIDMTPRAPLDYGVVPPTPSSPSSSASARRKVASVRMAATQVSGRLPAEVIRRVVRQRYGSFRRCYERGLGRDPNLEGLVTVRFVIGLDGAVSSASGSGSDLPDPNVVNCMVNTFHGLVFPRSGGTVSVKYPFKLDPG
jgi:hypothetical protein